MWPFSSDGGAACGSHHYGDWHEVGEYRIQPSQHGAIIEELHRRRCQHECFAEEERWHQIEVEVPGEWATSVDNSVEETEARHFSTRQNAKRALARYLQNEVDADE